ncbi:MAG: deoxyribodipyrimidine photo-lyase [Phycisphaerales bacterium]|nr:deoxyribodipyrimidine photo-lyase [Phycisphaerales bacterium]
MSSPRTSIVWFRNDLRLADQPALAAAAKRGGAVIPVFIWAPEEEGAWANGAASRWWLHQSLSDLGERLIGLGSKLIIRSGQSLATLRSLIEQTGADAIFWNRRYEPAIVKRDTTIKETLRSVVAHVESFNGSCLFEPVHIKNQQGDPYQVFTAFWRACMKQQEPARPLSSPRQLPAPKQWPDSESLEALRLEPVVDWATGMRVMWRPGEMGAKRQLKRFTSGACAEYAEGRDLPDREGTSRLSPHLHFGEISPRQIWHAIRKRQGDAGEAAFEESAETYLRELGWREFAHHLLVHFPQTPSDPLREQYRTFPWARQSGEMLRSWQRGQTGYPIVDAGMRELWATGWMHNRVRMIVASFLVKHLLIDWREGAAWFWDTLVDADLANNTLGWQWVAGCGADAAPYFRIFNPVLQGRKFDRGGDYVRKWIPELKAMPTKWIHAPWEAPVAELTKAGVTLGASYPAPIVDHDWARKRALAALEQVKQQ